MRARWLLLVAVIVGFAVTLSIRFMRARLSTESRPSSAPTDQTAMRHQPEWRRPSDGRPDPDAAACAKPIDCFNGDGCVDGRCGPCRSDVECVAGEACVRGRCVVTRQVECRSPSDCRGGAADCVVYGYPDGRAGRGNHYLWAKCVSRDHANPFSALKPNEPDPLAGARRRERARVRPDDLLERLRHESLGDARSDGG